MNETANLRCALERSSDPASNTRNVVSQIMAQLQSQENATPPRERRTGVRTLDSGDQPFVCESEGMMPSPRR